MYTRRIRIVACIAGSGCLKQQKQMVSKVTMPLWSLMWRREDAGQVARDNWEIETWMVGREYGVYYIKSFLMMLENEEMKRSVGGN